MPRSAKEVLPPDRITTDYTTADQNDRFKLELSAEVESIVAVHREGGFAELSVQDFDRKNELRLLPWGRLEGTFYINGKPSENQELSLHNLGPGKSGFNTDLGVFKSTTDQQGGFTFEFVPSRELTLSRMIRMDERSSRFGEKTNITVAPGAVTTFDFVVP